jgi:hypothetical protein
MRAEDFSARLSGVAGLSAATRGFGGAHEREGGQARSARRFRWRRRLARRRGAAAAKMRLARPAMSVWKAKAVRIARAARSSGWGRSHGLSRFRCKSCGRTFNALTKTPMAHLRKKERWLDHARAMIEGKSLAKTAQLCGVHPTTAFRWRHRFLRARQRSPEC